MKFVIVSVLLFTMSNQVVPYTLSRSKRNATEGAANSTVNTNTTKTEVKATLMRVNLSAEDTKAMFDEILKELFKSTAEVGPSEGPKVSTAAGSIVSKPIFAINTTGEKKEVDNKTNTSDEEKGKFLGLSPDKEGSKAIGTPTRPVETTETTPITTSANPTNITELEEKPVDNATLAANTTQKSTVSTQKTPAKGNDQTSTHAANTANDAMHPRNLIHRVSDFPVLLMMSIACTVLLALLFYNRNKIWGVITSFFHSKRKPDRAYVKVKLEDDVELPRQANREYIY